MKNSQVLNLPPSGSSLLISGCLIGLQCNYAGTCAAAYRDKPDVWNSLSKHYNLIPICPEQLGGMTTPRLPSELLGGAEAVFDRKAKVISVEGDDVSDSFIKGAFEALHLAKFFDAKFAILKSKSPSCGKYKRYDGTFSKTLVDGSGMAAYLLMKNGVAVITEREYLSLIK
ncbi:MAG: DUF523 domain-containing protein [Candidatus Riflebacteria bacterium]|nr:DUF523 domain-containing protein [Candidatus Riflebacteria bacterium]